MTTFETLSALWDQVQELKLTFITPVEVAHVQQQSRTPHTSNGNGNPGSMRKQYIAGMTSPGQNSRRMSGRKVMKENRPRANNSAAIENAGLTEWMKLDMNTSTSSKWTSVDDDVWKEATTAEGKVYYYNKRTRESRWDNPAQNHANPATPSVSHSTNNRQYSLDLARKTLTGGGVS